MKKSKLKVKKKYNEKIILIFLIIILAIIYSFINTQKNEKNIIETNIKQKNNIDSKQSIDYKYILVNKNKGLKNDFVPENLVKVEICSQGDFLLEQETQKAYQEMCIDSIKQNYNFSIASAYRSYEAQKNLYDYYLKTYGKSYIEKYVAPAGYSEHQTGLAIDLKSLNNKIFKNSKEYLWIKSNSYKYGFILRYQKDKEKITGYNAEEWHIRYVGKDAAKYIYDNNIAYEEYYKLFISDNY